MHGKLLNSEYCLTCCWIELSNLEMVKLLIYKDAEFVNGLCLTSTKAYLRELCPSSRQILFFLTSHLISKPNISMHSHNHHRRYLLTMRLRSSGSLGFNHAQVGRFLCELWISWSITRIGKSMEVKLLNIFFYNCFTERVMISKERVVWYNQF